MNFWQPQRGSILLLIMVIFSMFLVIMISGARLISRQFHFTADETQHEQALYVAESGINYTQWLLNDARVGASALRPVDNYEVRDPITEQLIGTFSASFTTSRNGPTTTVTATSIGKDPVLAAATETVVAILEGNDAAGYTVTSWIARP